MSLAACRDKDVDPFDDFGADFADDFDDDFAGDSTDDESTTADDESTSDDTTADESTTAEESTTADESTTESSTDGNGFPDDGTSCTSDDECMSNNCYLVPFLGGTCGECNEDADCPDGGCTAPNVFDSGIAVCNVGEFGGGCETTSVCMPGLVCANVLDLLGLIQITTCGECDSSSDCSNGQICARSPVSRSLAAPTSASLLAAFPKTPTVCSTAMATKRATTCARRSTCRASRRSVPVANATPTATAVVATASPESSTSTQPC